MTLTERSYAVDVQQLNHLRTEEGLAWRSVAKRLAISAKTLKRIRDGKRVDLSTIARMAKRLNKKTEELIQGALPTKTEIKTIEAGIHSKKGTPVTFIVVGPFSSFDETTDLYDILQKVTARIKQVGTVIPVDVSPGKSIHITVLYTDMTDVLSIIREFCRGTLSDLNIKRIDLYLQIGITRHLLGPGFSIYAPRFHSLAVTYKLNGRRVIVMERRDCIVLKELFKGRSRQARPKAQERNARKP